MVHWQTAQQPFAADCPLRGLPLNRKRQATTAAARLRHED
jgi:hypothetical protein